MKNNAPSVTVIIPAKNAAKFIGEALDSVARQTYQPLEVIVVDDHSTDGTCDEVRKYKKVKLLKTDKTGVSAARNTAIREAKGDYIANLDADDIWTPDKLKKQSALLKEGVVVLGQAQNWKQIGGKNQEIGNVFPNEAPKDLMTYVAFGANVPGSSWVVPRRAFEELGMFDENLLVGEDGDFFTRALLKDYQFKIVKERLVLRRLHDSNLHVAVYLSGFRSVWNIASNYGAHVWNAKARRKDVIDPDILLALVLIRFMIRGFNDIRFKAAKSMWPPYQLIALCIGKAMVTPRVWSGAVQGVFLYITNKKARATYRSMYKKWMGDAVYFAAIGKGLKAKS